jgi:hypothetical protein
LLEPQRTNAINISEYFGSNGQGGGAGFVITDNYAQSPEGYNNAARIQYTSGNTYMVANSVNMSTGEVVTMSIYAKGTAGEQFRLYCDGSSGATINTEFTLTADWARYETTSSAATTNGVLTPHILVGYGSSNPADDFQVYGWQGEKGSYPTSYIPTYGSSVTRNADRPQILNTTTDILSQTAFTLFFEADSTLDTTNNFMDIVAFRGSSSTLRIEKRTDSSVRVQQSEMITSGDSWNSATIGDTDNKKFAMTFTTSQVRLYADGSLVNTYNGAYSSDLVNILFRNSTSLGVETKTNFKQYILFTTALSNQEAIDLTTL